LSVFQLRPYQSAAVDAVIEARRKGLKRQLICLPTGSGKTVIFSRLASLARRPVLVLAHREELLEQAKTKIEEALGGAGKVSIEQGLRHADSDAKVVVCSIRSLSSKRLKRILKGRDFGLIVYDECHHAIAEDNQRVLTEIGVFEADFTGTLLGFTATTARADGQGLHTIFETIVYSQSLQQMIADAYLTPLRGYRIATEADLHEVTGAGRDFVVDELAEVIDIQSRNALVARSIQELARDRRILVFCVTVAHAKNLARALNHVGVHCGIVYGAMSKASRVKALSDFRAERTQALTNVGVLTEGFDDPGVSCIAMARPTRSSALYTQCVGRGTRLFPGKRDCLILDFVDASELSLVTLPSLFGMPGDLHLEGEEAHKAAQSYFSWMDEAPGFEVEPGEITLSEIKRRVAGFNPLNLEIHEDILAISGNAWISLGRVGLALHCFLTSTKASEYVVLDSKKRGKKRYNVQLDGNSMAHFSRLEDAVEAVDYEVQKRGPRVARSALEDAKWRQQATPNQLEEQLSALRPARHANNYGEALRYLIFARYYRN
jgi:ATP-dependent helicase IRC3